MKRSAFTLLEMLLAMAIAVVLLSALYIAMDFQLRRIRDDRETVQQADLARKIFARFTADLIPNLGQSDPSRYTGGSSGSSSSSSSGSTGSSSGSTGSSSGSKTTASSSSSASSSTASGSNSSSNSTSTSSSTTSTPSFLFVLQGDQDTLTLFLTKVPPDPYNDPNAPNLPTNSDGTLSIGDLRRVYYFLAADGGLACQELKQVTSDDVANDTTPSGLSDPTVKLLASEVKTLQFEYWDGTQWATSWDGTQTSPLDGVTPIGPPQAIRITLGLALPTTGDNGEEAPVKTYRHVVAIPAANTISLEAFQALTNQTQSTTQSSSTQQNQSTSGTTP